MRLKTYLSRKFSYYSNSYKLFIIFFDLNLTLNKIIKKWNLNLKKKEKLLLLETKMI